MNRDVTPPRYSALVVPFDAEIWPDHTTLTQAGPRAGVPVPVDGEGASRMALAARGTQTGDLQVRTQKGGFAIRSAGGDSASLKLDTGATFIWRTATTVGSTTTYGDWRGWDPPRAVSRYQSIAACDNSSTTIRYTKNVHAIRLASGNVMAVAEAHTPAAASPFEVAVWVRSGTTDAWSKKTSVFGATVAPTKPFCPAICQLPSGRILCYFVSYDSVALFSRCQGWFSDDEGVTWSVINDSVLARRWTHDTVNELRVAYKDGQILMIGRGDDGSGNIRIEQFASSDLGNSFDWIEYDAPAGVAATYDITSADICASPQGFVLVQNATSGTSSERLVWFRLLGDAYLASTSAPEVYILPPGTSNNHGGGETAITCDETGTLYAYVRWDIGTDIANYVGRIYPYVSFDSGQSWTTYADTMPTIYVADTAFPREVAVAAIAGSVVMLGNATVTGTAPPATAPASPTPTNLDDSLHCWQLGGFTEVCLPRYSRSFGSATVQGWRRSWTPIEYPGAVGWTRTTAATATESITVSSRLVLTTDATGTMIYSITPTGTSSDGLMVRMILSVQTRATIGQQVSSLIRLDDGTQVTGVRAEFDTTQWRLVDNVSGATIGVAQAYTATSATVEVLIGIRGRSARSWWREPNNETESGVRSWTTGPATTTLTTAATGAGDTIAWGHRAAGISTSTWYDFSYADDPAINQNLADGQTSPNDLYGRPYASMGDGVYVAAGTTIEARGGPTWLGESWDIERRYDYGIERALTFPSPRHTWKATTNSEIIALLWGTLGTNAYASRGLTAIYLGNCNAETVAVAYRNVGGASWTTLGTADRCVGLGSLAFDQMNKSVRPTTDAGIFLRANEFAGGWFVDVTAGTIKQIVSHPEGKWASSAPLRTMLHLDGSIGTTTGRTNGKIIPKDTVILVDLSGIDTPAIRLTLAKSSTTDAVQAGLIKIGKVVGLGTRYDWGRTIDLDLDGAELAESRDRTIRSLAAAPPRRIVSVAWADTAIDQTDADRFGDPDYILGGNAAIAGVQSTAYTIEGVAREIEGAVDPIVYLPSLGPVSSLKVLNRRHEMLYGRLTSGVSIENVLGEEGDSELVRVATITLQEEV